MNNLSDTFISSLVKNIKKECLMKGLLIPADRLVVKMIQILRRCPNITAYFGDSQKLAEKLNESIVRVLKIPKNPSVMTLNLQIFFSEKNVDSAHILMKRLQTVEFEMLPLFNLIAQKRIVKGSQDLNQLYLHICNYVILVSGIGNPCNNEKLEEYVAILKSVLTPEELNRFTSKVDVMKKRQLEDISRIVVGIKIFNDRDKKNDETSSRLLLIGNAMKQCHGFLIQLVREVEDQISSSIHHYTKFNLHEGSQSVIEDGENGDRYYSKSYLIFLQQMKIYLKILLGRIGSLLDEYESCNTLLQQNLERVRKTIKFRTAIPVVEIYPQFRDISSCWNTMQDFLVMTNYLADSATHFRNFFDKVPRPKYNKIQMDVLKYNRRSQTQDAFQLLGNLGSDICEYVGAEDENFQNFKVEYNGFCPVVFVDNDVLLIAGIKEYGLIKYRNLYFCFSSLEAMSKFVEQAKMYTKNIRELVWEWPEIFDLMQLENHLDSIESV